MDLKSIGSQAKKASKELAYTDTHNKNKALLYLSDLMIDSMDLILEENAKDCAFAKDAHLSDAMIDRMFLNKERIHSIANDLHAVVELHDPIGELIEEKKLQNGLVLQKKRTPLGVIGVIYESRPNVTIDVAALAIKTGNAAILRGGKETIHTNRIFSKLIREALKKAALPENGIQFIDSTERHLVLELLKMHEYIEMIIPRGGASLHQFCRENSTIPVITGGIGICHLFIDKSADLKKSIDVVVNAKTQKPTVCNALDTLLVHQEIAPQLLPEMIKTLASLNVKFKVDKKTKDLIQKLGLETLCKMEDAKEHDWNTEWLNLTLGIKIVSTLEEVIAHIDTYGSGHSDGILSESEKNVKIFFSCVDSAVLYHNASTRFTDGGQFGFGAEIAVSTQKLHARGPMGLHELTSYHWEVLGNYHTR